MDPRERADAALARARARGAFVVTPESAISPMDAASTLQIPRTVVVANDERQNDPDATMVVPGSVARGRGNAPAEETLPAIAQEALTDVVSAPPGIRSRQRRIEDAERARQAVHQQKPSPTPKPKPSPGAQPAPSPAPHAQPAQQSNPQLSPVPHGQPGNSQPSNQPGQQSNPQLSPVQHGQPGQQSTQQLQKPSPVPHAQSGQNPQPSPAPQQPDDQDGLIPTTKEPPATRSTLSQRLDG